MSPVERLTVIGARLSVIVACWVVTAAGLVGTVHWMRELVRNPPPVDTRWGMFLWQAVGGVAMIGLILIAAIVSVFIMWLSIRKW